jgi:hypothetical protein
MSDDGPMSIMILGTSQIADIHAMIDRARANVIPWKVLEPQKARNQETNTLTLEDRAGITNRPLSQQLDLPLGYRLCASCEEQPAGLCLHLSLSCNNDLPHPAMMGALLQVLGFEPEDVAGLSREWVEDFLVDGKPGGRALNFVFLIERAWHA